MLAEQTAKVARVAESRDAARRGEDSATSKLIRVAVYDFELLNVARSLGSATTEALLEEIRKLEGVSAIGMDEIREMLDFEAQRQAMGLDCDADDACFAEIAGALGVDEMITGKLTEEADGRSLLIKRIDQRRAESDSEPHPAFYAWKWGRILTGHRSGNQENLSKTGLSSGDYPWCSRAPSAPFESTAHSKIGNRKRRMGSAWSSCGWWGQLRCRVDSK